MKPQQSAAPTNSYFSQRISEISRVILVVMVPGTLWPVFASVQINDAEVDLTICYSNCSQRPHTPCADRSYSPGGASVHRHPIHGCLDRYASLPHPNGIAVGSAVYAGLRVVRSGCGCCRTPSTIRYVLLAEDV